MEPITHRFSDLDEAIDRVHDLFQQWEDERRFEPLLDGETLHRLKLAVHEWIANLVQHADFDDRVPAISVTLHPNRDNVQCIIDDNSEGFDLDGHLSANREVLDAFPERGMGLLMIKASTDDLSYRELGEARHRLEFCVSGDQDPWLNIPF